jgi:AmmeMemoRadiSam system protein A
MNLLNYKQQQKLLNIARQTLESYLRDKKKPEIKVKDSALEEKLGAFVTLRKNGQLKGCLGEFESEKPLYQVIQDKVIAAAVNDPRFKPLTYQEIKNVRIEISVLSPRQKIYDWQQIELGKHGVVIKRDLRSGTFLPQVAQESGWDLETFLANLCWHKAGLPPDYYKESEAEIYTFTAQVFGEKRT